MMSLMDKSQMITLHIQGKSNREIANIMNVSRNTVNKYIRDYKKLQAQLAESWGLLSRSQDCFSPRRR